MSAEMSPTTTLEQDKHSSTQRRINLTWEFTQAAVALMATGAYIYTSTKGVVSEGLGNAFFLIIGFYFSRTNHARINDTAPRLDTRMGE